MTAVDSRPAVDSPAAVDTPPADRGSVDTGPPPAILTPRTAVNLFLSGHSLINLDMPWNVGQLAAANSQMHHYNLQMRIESNLAVRVSGGNEQDQKGDRITFAVLDEIRNATTLAGLGGHLRDRLFVDDLEGWDAAVYYQMASSPHGAGDGAVRLPLAPPQGGRLRPPRAKANVRAAHLGLSLARHLLPGQGPRAHRAGAARLPGARHQLLDVGKIRRPVLRAHDVASVQRVPASPAVSTAARPKT